MSAGLSARGQCDRGKDGIGTKRVGEIGEQRPARPYRCLWTATGEAVVPHRGRKRQAHIPSQDAQAFYGHLDELAPTLHRAPQFVRVNHTRQSTPHKFCAPVDAYPLWLRSTLTFLVRVSLKAHTRIELEFRIVRSG